MQDETKREIKETVKEFLGFAAIVVTAVLAFGFGLILIEMIWRALFR